MIDDGLDPPVAQDTDPKAMPTIAALSPEERLMLAAALRMGGPRMLKPRRDGVVALPELGVAIGCWYPDLRGLGQLGAYNVQGALHMERILTVWGFDQRRIVVHGTLVTACRKALRDLVRVLESPLTRDAHKLLDRHRAPDEDDLLVELDPLEEQP